MRRVVAIAVPLLLALAAAPGVAAAASEPPVVNVRTVPAVSGLKLTFEGRRDVTNSAGRVENPPQGERREHRVAASYHGGRAAAQ